MGSIWTSIKKELTTGVNVSFTNHDRVRKLAGIFAGLGHLQPLLLATTNANYLLDRFCMERCCSSEYISRIVTSLIFMEVMATLIVAPTGIYIANWQSDNATGQDLNKWNEDEEKVRGIVGSIILLLISIGYVQILLAFLSGGKKGHMHWFYTSLLIQHFLNSLIAGSIGFWEVGLALWYLATLPMAPIVIFFYQLMIHSWIRNNGPRYPEYIVVEWQIGLAILISALATTYWIIGYIISYYPIELKLNLQDLNTLDDTGRITANPGKAITLNLTNAPVQSASGATIGSVKVKTVELTTYSLALLTAQSGSNKKFVTTTLRAALTIEFEKKPESAGGTVKVESADKDPSKPMTLKYTGIQDAPNLTAKPGVAAATVNKKPDDSNNSVEIALAVEEITVTSVSSTITNLEITIPVKIEVKKTARGEQDGEAAAPVTITSVVLKLPVPGQTSQNNLTIHSVSAPDTNTLNITVEAAHATVNEVAGKGFTPTNPGYCIYSVRDSTGERDIWANIGGKCEYVACYKKDDNDKALLCLYLRTDDTLKMKYYGKESNDWKEFKTGADFIKNLGSNIKTLDSPGRLEGLGEQETDQYNRGYEDALWYPGSWTMTSVWYPLLMQGLSVGSFGSIFPNLIPKTLTCPKTTRSLSVMNMFLVTLPHIFNVLLADNNPGSSWFPGVPWDEYPGDIWAWSLLYYIIYFLAILFAIFNIHYPEWRLSSFLRSNTWFVFLMILFTDVLNESFNAISRAGICSQKAAGGEKKNHPCLHNKIHCLMNLTYIPFWMTTTPMMNDDTNG